MATLIYTPQDLQDIIYNVQGDYELANDIDLAGFDPNITMTDPFGDSFTIHDWLPIMNMAGGEPPGFCGTLDGKGYTIKNLTMSVQSGLFSGGLFGLVHQYMGSPATIQHLRLENINITNNVGGTTGGLVSSFGTEMGGFSASGCTIANIEVTGQISFSEPEGGTFGGPSVNGYGGLIGEFYGRPASVRNNYSRVEMINTQAGWQAGNIGGVCGVAEADSGYIERCYYAGLFTGDFNIPSAGPIIGLHKGDLSAS